MPVRPSRIPVTLEAWWISDKLDGEFIPCLAVCSLRAFLLCSFVYRNRSNAFVWKNYVVSCYVLSLTISGRIGYHFRRSGPDCGARPLGSGTMSLIRETGTDHEVPCDPSE